MSIKIDTGNPEDLTRPKYEPLESGKYDLEITNKLQVTPTKDPAKDGKNYGKIEVIFKDPESGKEVKDYIALHPKMKWKLNQFALSAGVIEKGESGDIELPDFDGRVVTAIVGQRTWTKTDGSGETGVSNEIKEYIYE